MTRQVLRTALFGALVVLNAVAAVAQGSEKTETLSGSVIEVDGGTLIVKMDTGEVRSFTPPADAVFTIDGKPLKLNQLQPGTKLTATYKTTSTTTMAKTVDTLEGTVVYAAGPTVILRLPSNERRQFHIKANDPVKFYNHEGKEITVFDLRKNMNIKATKITEAPKTELATNTTVTGTAPATAAAPAQQAAAAAPAQQPAAARPAAAPAAPAAQPAAATASAEAGEKPKTLPKTGSSLPLLGLVGLSSLAIGVGLTIARRFTV
jgi:LPXTG-motif cell wall-anchored protein